MQEVFGPGQFRHNVHPDKLVDITMHARDAMVVVERVMERIRHLTWRGKGRDVCLEIHRAARICYEIEEQLTDACDGVVRLTRMGKEDVAILINVPKSTDIEALNRFLVNDVNPVVREAGPVSPVEADYVVKSLIEVMST